MRRWALIAGLVLMLLFALGAPIWQRFFHTASFWPFVILAVGLPFYLMQGVDRGVLQGQTRFKLLSGSYQIEMWVRLLGAVRLGIPRLGREWGCRRNLDVAGGGLAIRNAGREGSRPGESPIGEDRRVIRYLPRR